MLTPTMTTVCAFCLHPEAEHHPSMEFCRHPVPGCDDASCTCEQFLLPEIGTRE